MNPTISALIVAGVIVVAAIATAFTIHQRRLGRHRGVPREEFIGSFAEVPQDITAVVYDYYQGQVISKNFSIAPDDEFEHVLSAGDEEIDDDTEALMKTLGLRRPPDYAMARSETRIRTIGDMVRWLNWVRTHQPDGLRL